MTAIIAWKASSPEPSVQIATDSRWIGGGVNGHKVLTLPHLNAAIVVQGAIMVLPTLAQELCTRSDRLAHAAAIFPSMVALARSIIIDTARENGTYPEFIAVLAGIDDQGKRHLVSCSTINLPDFPAFQAVTEPTFVALPATPEILAAMDLPADTDDIRPRDAVRLINAQRDGGIVALDGSGLLGGEMIGGPVVWTGIFRDRIEQRVVGVL